MAMQNDPSREDIEKIIGGVTDPVTGHSLLDAGRVESCMVENGRIRVTLAVSATAAAGMEKAASLAEKALDTAFAGWRSSVLLTAHRAPAAPTAPAGGGHRPLGGVGAKGTESGPLLPQVGAVIAIASGKGGVGKSTTAVNLAAGLVLEGLSVGLMDADIHGPSLPRMLGVKGKPEVRDGKLLPVEAWGLRAMSIGMLVDETQAMVWRGPMVMGAISQLLGDVSWGALDVLVVDMPPGTGDAQLTLAQKAVLNGAIIVSTPQDIALLDARRGVTMFEKTHVPVLGLVENMSYFCCPNCNHRTELFGHGGARDEAARLGVPFLGEIPLLADIRSSSDAGTPIVVDAPDSEAGRAYRALAAGVAAVIRKLPRRR
ncbi:Mrp/NBP35 family ATP-binding protein [Acetobacter conturbans]|uniref:Iron-sulfur cluster carrier protein n=1 Tax=Acetobacter conturbans TaxID=1737472 RepID=A0ABX0K382_9PROT|nr:Mrp/NBP35 family ATP-binding protein [Acetobacter conturbans]NHN88685.1 P-loop NTPase [Acetobacter conturbans]